MQIYINDSSIRDMAHNLTPYLDKKKVMFDGKPAKFNHALQFASQMVAKMPYEKLKTEMAKPRQPVWVLGYGGDIVVAYDGNYLSSRAPGTDMEVSEDTLLQLANVTAGHNNTDVRRTSLPEVLGEDWEYDEIIELAKKLGLFKGETSLYEMMYTSGVKFFFGNIHCSYGPDHEMEIDEDAPYDSVIWHAEYQSGHDAYELYITVNDIINAEPLENGKWLLELGLHGGSVTLDIFTR